MNNFKEILKSVLKEQGLTKKQASEICSMSPQRFGQLANGNNNPSFNEGMKIIDKLNWKIACFPKSTEL